MENLPELTLNVAWQYLPRWNAPARRAGPDKLSSGTVSSSSVGKVVFKVTTIFDQCITLVWWFEYFQKNNLVEIADAKYSLTSYLPWMKFRTSTMNYTNQDSVFWHINVNTQYTLLESKIFTACTLYKFHLLRFTFLLTIRFFFQFYGFFHQLFEYFGFRIIYRKILTPRKVLLSAF